MYDERYDKTKPWYDQAEDICRVRALKHEKYTNIYISSDPRDGMTKATADSFDAILNVSCTQCVQFEPSRIDQRNYWFPVNEMGYWTYNWLFYTKQVLDYHFEKGHKILVHCHAGAYRSPTTVLFWLISMGHSFDEAYCISKNNPNWWTDIAKDNDPSFTVYCRTHYFRDGNVPKNYQKFYDVYNKMKHEGKNLSLASILLQNEWIEVTPEVFGRPQSLKSHKRRLAFPRFYMYRRKLHDYFTQLEYKAKGQLTEKVDICTRITDNPNSLVNKLPKPVRKKYLRFIEKTFRLIFKVVRW